MTTPKTPDAPKHRANTTVHAFQNAAAEWNARRTELEEAQPPPTLSSSDARQFSVDCASRADQCGQVAARLTEMADWLAGHTLPEVPTAASESAPAESESAPAESESAPAE